MVGKNNNKRARQWVRALVGRKCVAVVGGWGSLLQLHFGPLRKMARPIDNARLPDRMQTYEGAMVVFIENAAWRMIKDDRIVVGSNDNTARSDISKMLAGMSGRGVRVARLTIPGAALTIQLAGAVRIEVLPLESVLGVNDESYHLRLNDEWMSVLRGGRIVFAHRRDQGAGSPKRALRVVRRRGAD